MTLPYKVLAWALLLGTLAAGFFTYRTAQREFGAEQERAVWAAKLTIQKEEAQVLLDKELLRSSEARTELAATIASLGTQREKLQTENAANLSKYTSTYRLQYTPEPGRRLGGVGTQSGKAGTANDTSATSLQLPKQISDNLLKLAADADSLAIDYGILFTYVNNPKLVCELREPTK